MFLKGVLAGYGIAIPVGPIAILILELGIQRGFSFAFCAGAGAASADLFYAAIAVLAGTLLASMLAPFSGLLRIVSASALILIGVWLLARALLRKDKDQLTFSTKGYLPTYTMVLGLTLLNPVTVTYFTTLILGLKATSSGGSLYSVLFVAGAFLASLSWQTFLAAISGVAHRRFPKGLQMATFAVGNFVIIVMGFAIFFGLI